MSRLDMWTSWIDSDTRETMLHAWRTCVSYNMCIEDTEIIHLLIEAAMIGYIIYLLFFTKSYRLDDKNNQKLTEKEKDELIADWEPEPLARKDFKIPERDRNPVIEGPSTGSKITIGGRQLINMGTFNFLGMADDKKVKKASADAIAKYGVGSCGPRGFYGTIDVHLNLEEELAKFMGTEEAILYSYGFSTIASVIPAYSKRKDILFVDKGVCYAAQTGIVASRSDVVWYEHNDLDDLERLLKIQAEKDKRDPRKAKSIRRFIITEGISLNYGDIVDLPRLIELKYKYFCRIFLEESFSFGVLGENGRGVTEYYGVDVEDVDAIAVGMGNSLGSVGGFCVGRTFIIDHQRLSGQGYCFSASLPPMLAACASVALKKIENSKGARDSLVSKSKRAREIISAVKGIDISYAEKSPIFHIRIPGISVDCERKEIEQTENLLQRVVDLAREKGVAVTRARYVRETEAYAPPPSIRMSISNTLTMEEVAQGATALSEALKKVLK